jgi:hypothetical protein
MRAFKRYLLKVLVAAVVGALLGALLGGDSWAIRAILGAGLGMVGASLYDPHVVVHSWPTYRGDTTPYNRDD